MNNFLITIGATLVLALTAALVGPSFVDWNAYRAAAEAEAAKVFGLPVEIAGDLDVAILPVPVVRAAAIRVLSDDPDEPYVVADEAKLAMGLGALVLGEIEITDLELVRPEFRLDRVAAGVFDLERGMADGADGNIPRRIEAREAKVVFDDPFNGGVRIVSGVDFALVAGSSDGPFRITGQYGEDGDAERPAFSVSLGSISPGAPIKLTGRAALIGIGNVAFDGELAGTPPDRRFSGKVRLERELSAADGVAGGKLAVETLGDVRAGDADFDMLRITASRGAHALTFAGSGRISWSGVPDFTVDLKALQIDLDGFFADQNGDPAVPGAFAEIAQGVKSFILGRGARGQVQLSLGGAAWRKELVRDIAAKLEITPDAIKVTNFTGLFPGETEVSLSGYLDIRSEPRFTGDLVANTIGVTRLVAWGAPEDAVWVATLLSNTRGKLSIRARAEAGPTVLSLERIDGFIDADPFTGSIALEIDGDRRVLSASLDFDHLDLDRYLPPDTHLPDLLDAALADAGADRAGPGFPDFSIDLAAKRLSFQGHDAEAVNVSAALAGGILDIERLEIGQIASSALSAEGRIEPSPDGPLGELDVTIESESLPTLLAALQLPLGEFAATSMLNFDVADIVLSLASTRGEAGHRVTASLSGDLAGVIADLSLGSDAPPRRLADGPLRLDGVFEAEDGRDLFGPQGLIPVFASGEPAGPASMALTVEGNPSEGLDLAVELSAYEAEVEATGRLAIEPFSLSGDIRVAAADTSVIVAALGLGEHERLVGASTALTASFVTSGDRILIEPIAGTLASAEIGAALGLTPSDALAADLDFHAEFGSLPAVAAILFSGASGADGEAGSVGPGGWPTALIDVGIFDKGSFSVKGHIGSLALTDGTALADASIEARLADGEITLDRLDGRLDDGELHIEGTGRSVDHALAVDGKVGLAGIALEDLLADGAGRGLLNGRLSGDAAFEARGRSLLSLVSSLSGSGAFNVSDVALPRFDAAMVFDIGEVADSEAAVAAAILGGAAEFTDLGAVSGTIDASGGRIKLGPLPISGGIVSGEATSFVDLASLHFDQEIALARSDRPGGIHLSLIHAGAFDDIGRDVEVTNLPGLGTARWTEPAPGPGGSSAPPAPQRSGGSAPAQGGAGAGASPTTTHPPAGLIGQDVIDLPILEPPRAGKSDGDSG